MPALTPCLWFDNQAEEAASFYINVFPNSRIRSVSRYTETGKEIHKQPPGSVMTVEFELDGKTFTGLNGGAVFTFNEAVSFQIMCKDQKEIDHYWDKLTAGGDPKAQQCGWLKDKYGVSWQVVPIVLQSLVSKSSKATAAMLKMKKIDIAALERAASE